MDEVEQIKKLGESVAFVLDHPKLRDLTVAATWLWVQGCAWSVKYAGVIPLHEVQRQKAHKAAATLVDHGLWKIVDPTLGWSMKRPSKAVAIVKTPQERVEQVYGPIAMTFTTVGVPSTWPLSEAYLAEMERDFAPLDVRAQCRYAHAWLMANPAKRKTARGMSRFLVSWMTRAVDRPGAASDVVRKAGIGRTGPAPEGKYANTGVADE